MKNDLFFKHIDEQYFKDLFINNELVEDILFNLKDYIINKVKDCEEKNYFNDGTVIKGKCLIGTNTNIYPNVTIMGPVIIGNNVEIMSGALIRPYSIIGDNCVIGHASEVKHSILMNNSKLGSFCFVGDSIIGYKGRIGSGSILANRRFDQNNVQLKYEDKIIDLKTDFFGSIIGDNTRLGANVTCYPGTFIGNNTWIFPSTIVKGYVESLKRVSNDRITNNLEYELKN